MMSRVGEVIADLMRNGAVVSRLSGTPHDVFPVAIPVAEGEACVRASHAGVNPTLHTRSRRSRKPRGVITGTGIVAAWRSSSPVTMTACATIPSSTR